MNSLRSVGTAHRVRTPSRKGVADSSAASAAETGSSAPPRAGSPSRIATMEVARMGTIRIMNAARQPRTAPTTPANAGPAMAPRYMALVWSAYTAGRVSGG